MALPDTMTTHTPAELTKLADNVWKASQKLKREVAKLKVLKESVDALETELLDAMIAAKMESIASRNATISVKRNTFAELYDDKKFFEYVGRHKAWDLVRKQPVVSACQERWDDGVPVPGVRPGTRVDLSITTRNK